MAGPFAFGQAEVLSFTQRGLESWKDAWYRINDSQKRATKKQSTTILLRNFYVGITSWNRFVLHTAIKGNFIEAPVWEALNVIENLVGSLPIASIKEDITLAHIMGKLEKIELEMPSIDRVNELDHKVEGNLNRLDSSMQKNFKTLETIKSLDEKSSRIEKIEEVIETLGTTFSSIKTRKDGTPAKKEPTFVYVPKVPRAKANTPIAKRVETVKTLEETPIFNFNETPIEFPPFG